MKVLVLCTGNFSRQLFLLHNVDLISIHSVILLIHIFTKVRIQTYLSILNVGMANFFWRILNASSTHHVSVVISSPAEETQALQ